MNFPMELPLFQILYAIVNSAGLGGIAVALVAGGSLTAYALTLRWINQAGKTPEKETYAYPTPALHHSEHDDQG
jgi:hypothetical protein